MVPGAAWTTYFNSFDPKMYSWLLESPFIELFILNSDSNGNTVLIVC